MSMNLPPQAYTRETLMLAFDWIKSQPKQIQELATTSDALVSIYMQARRRGGQLSTTPVSSQSFKQDLKNLAEGLKEFAGAEPLTAQSLPPQAPVHMPQMPIQTQVQQPVQPPIRQAPSAYSAPVYATPPPMQQPVVHQPLQQPTPQQTYYAAATPAFDSDATLDAKSLDAVRRVQQRFNLSSENEAIRLLIALGFEKFREMTGKF